MNNKKFCVYEHLFPNGKRYIGITSKKPNARWENGRGYSESHQNVMYKAIQKYGWDNIQHNILFENLTFEEAKQKEIELIKQYHTYVHDENSMGYNMTLGGEGALGHKAGENVSRTNRERMLGKKGKDCVNSRPVICDGIEYESLTQFLEKYPITKNVTQWLSGKVGMPKEWYDRKLYYKDLGFDVVKLSNNKSKRRTIIFDGKEFKSQKEVADYLHVTPSQISVWLNGKESMPIYIKEKGLYRKDGTHIISDIEPKHPSKEKVFYNGKIYNSQAELARELNIEKGTLWTYLNGKSKIPKYLQDGNLHKIDIKDYLLY
jgi:transcriptional regulator with XRE-family HTH domain